MRERNIYFAQPDLLTARKAVVIHIGDFLKYDSDSSKWFYVMKYIITKWGLFE